MVSLAHCKVLRLVVERVGALTALLEREHCEAAAPGRLNWPYNSKDGLQAVDQPATANFLQENASSHRLLGSWSVLSELEASVAVSRELPAPQGSAEAAASTRIAGLGAAV